MKGNPAALLFWKYILLFTKQSKIAVVIKPIQVAWNKTQSICLNKVIVTHNSYDLILPCIHSWELVCSGLMLVTWSKYIILSNVLYCGVPVRCRLFIGNICKYCADPEYKYCQDSVWLSDSGMSWLG